MRPDLEQGHLPDDEAEVPADDRVIGAALR